MFDDSAQLTPEEKKQRYLEHKATVLKTLGELTSILEQAGEDPISGEQRKSFMDKFAQLDHRLLDRLDASSFLYFETIKKPTATPVA